jgi:hypothetical protein
VQDDLTRFAVQPGRHVQAEGDPAEGEVDHHGRGRVLHKQRIGSRLAITQTDRRHVVHGPQAANGELDHVAAGRHIKLVGAFGVRFGFERGLLPHAIDNAQRQHRRVRGQPARAHGARDPAAGHERAGVGRVTGRQQEAGQEGRRHHAEVQFH